MKPDTLCDLIFKHIPCCAVTCKLMPGTDGHFEDFCVTTINQFLRGLLNKEMNLQIGKSAREYLNARVRTMWLERMETAVRTEEIGHYEEYAETMKWDCSVTIFPVKTDECAVMLIMKCPYPCSNPKDS
jgi:hypothetical protein